MTIPERIQHLREAVENLNQLVVLKRDELRMAELQLAETQGRLAELSAMKFVEERTNQETP